MGWWGYGIYGGDGTQSCQYEFLEAAGCGKVSEIMDEWISRGKIKIPKDKIEVFQKNFKKMMAKIPKRKFWDEDLALSWQMLLALYVDNNLPVPKLIKEKGVTATEFLLEESCEFDNPGQRRRVLKKFIEKAKKLKLNQEKRKIK